MFRLTRISRPRASIIYVMLLVLSSVAFGLAANNMNGSEVPATEIFCEAELLIHDADQQSTVEENS